MLFCRLNSGVSSSGCCAVNDAHSSIEPNNNCIHLLRWLHVLCTTSDCGKHATHETADNGSLVFTIIISAKYFVCITDRKRDERSDWRPDEVVLSICGRGMTSNCSMLLHGLWLRVYDWDLNIVLWKQGSLLEILIFICVLRKNKAYGNDNGAV